MVTSVVSIRMPSSLVQKLRELAEQNHFLDISEEVRSIIKHEIRRIKTGQEPEEKPLRPVPETDYKTQNMVRQELVKRLRQVIKEIENEK